MQRSSGDVKEKALMRASPQTQTRLRSESTHAALPGETGSGVVWSLAQLKRSKAAKKSRLRSVPTLGKAGISELGTTIIS